MEVTDFLVYAKDIANLITSIVLCLVAVMGLNTWRKQLIANTEYEHARKLLRAVYQVREAIKVVRNPIVISGETLRALKELDVVTNEKSIDSKLQNEAVYQMRWKQLSSAIERFDAEVFEAEVLWGKSILEITQNIGQQVGKLRWAISVLLGAPERILAAKYEEVQEIAYETFWEDTDNAFTKSVEQAIKELEDFLKPKLKIKQ